MTPRYAVAGPVLLATLTLAGAVLLGACGGGSSPAGKSPTPPSSTSPAPSPTAGDLAGCGIDLAQQEPEATVYGASAGDFLADRFSLASSDFNGDGIDDLLVGAPLARGPGDTRIGAGEAYVFLGSSGLSGALDVMEGAADVTIFGDAPSGNLGFTVAAGDVNDDGTADILVGARFAGPGAAGRGGEGQVYAIYGRANLPAEIDIADGDQDLTVTGAKEGDYLGIALAAGDVNGDGVDDFIIGASGGDGPQDTRGQAGEVYVVLGGADLPPSTDLAEDEAAFTVYGAKPSDLIPNHLSAGDLNGDGKDELIIGAPAAGRPTLQDQPMGEAYIIEVPNETPRELDLAGDGGFTRLRGAAAPDIFGFFTAAGDLNGDGLDDAVIGARDADGLDDSRNNSGEVHVLFGRKDLPAQVSLADKSLDVTIFGRDMNDSLGFTVATGDVDADGIDDLLLGAPLADGCGNRAEDAGEAYVILGRSDWPDRIDLASDDSYQVVSGAEAGDQLAFSLLAADPNGDGLDDIIVGALQADGPDNARPDAGEAYFIPLR